MYEDFFLNNSSDTISTNNDVNFDLLFNNLSSDVENVNKMIAEMWHGLILAYFGEDIGINELIQVQKDWHYSLVLLNDKGAFKKHIAMLGERILGISPVLSPIIRTSYPDLSFDYANMSHTEWHSNTDDKMHKENFFEYRQTGYADDEDTMIPTGREFNEAHPGED